ncbi:MAG: ATP-binding cassette domain-containing protein, partial [Actinomycetota bacterium]
MTTALVARQIGVVRNDVALLTGVDLTVQSGEFVAVLGPNGAGKSTLIGAIAGDFVLQSGDVAIDGRGLDTLSPRELARVRAVLPQQILISFPFTVREVVAMGRNPWLDSSDDAKIDAAMRRLDVDALRDRTYQTLSVGEQARVSMA